MLAQKLRKALAVTCIALAPVTITYQVAFAGQAPTAHQSASTTSENLELGELTSGIERYLVQTSSGVAFDVEAARTANEHSQIIEAGQNFNRIQQTQNQSDAPSPLSTYARDSFSSSRDAQPQGLKVPVWGNWCGPGHSGPGAL